MLTERGKNNRRQIVTPVPIFLQVTTRHRSRPDTWYVASSNDYLPSLFKSWAFGSFTSKMHLTLCMLGNFAGFCRLLIIFKICFFSEKFFQIKGSNSLGPDQARSFVGPQSGSKLC